MTSAALTLDPAAHELIAALHRELRAAWERLPTSDEAAPVPASYAVAAIPNDLLSRRAELIVEASDTAALRAALRGDADAVVVDFDDTFSPTLANVQRAYDVLSSEVGNSDKALLCRTRALYAAEPHLGVDGQTAIAALCDLALALTARPARPLHIYIPKLETVAEARFWNEALLLAERQLGWEAHTVKVCLQIETFQGLRRADELLYTLRERAYGLNAGRWDYVFSLTKALGESRGAPMPPRSGLTMEVDAMRAYAEKLVALCRLRGAEAIGGTASFAPDPADAQPALSAVRADKQREAEQGFTAAWAGLPELLEAVRRGFDTPAGPSAGGDLAQMDARLTRLPDPGPLRLADLHEALEIALGVFAAWYRGEGVLVRQGRIEDTATAELARAQLWQWVKVGAALEDGTRLTRQRYEQERGALMPADSARPGEAQAARLLDHLVRSVHCPAYFPQEARRLEETNA